MASTPAFLRPTAAGLVADVETFVVDNPPPHFGGRYFVFVKVTTTEGVVGWGEIYAATFHPVALPALVADVAGRHLLDRDPHNIETFTAAAMSRGYSGRPEITLGAIVSGLEMACWDIIGKAAGRPVADLIGGRVRDHLRAYTYLYPTPGDPADVYGDPAAAAAKARFEVDRGFTAVKLDPMGGYGAFDPRMPSLEKMALAEAFCQAIRDEVGDAADICFGTHGQYSVDGAIRLARRLERFDPLWFEEPNPPTNPSAMAEVNRSTTIPVATGERLNSVHEFAAVLNAGAARILQPNIARCGGVLAGRKIAIVAETHHAAIAPHCYNGPVGAAANIAVAAASPNLLIVEAIQTFGGFHAELLIDPIEVHDGHVVVPDRPGLGVEVDEAVARANPYLGTDLHLEVSDTPIPW